MAVRWSCPRAQIDTAAPASAKPRAIERPIPRLPLEGIHWVIVGGESGPGARPLETRWVEDILQQCRAADVAFFLKQWGGVQKHRTGRELYGRTFDELPVI